MRTKPQPEQYPTRARYRWALRNWKRSHGGSLLAVLAIAIIFGGLSGSTVLLLLLVTFAIVAWGYARTRP